MKITRMFTGPDGQTHLEDVDMPLSAHNVGSPLKFKEQGVTVQQTELVKVTGMQYRETIGLYNSAWHNAPRRQFVIHLEGVQEVEVSDGTKRLISPGDIWLCDDTTGKGHISRDIKSPRSVIVLTVD